MGIYYEDFCNNKQRQTFQRPLRIVFVGRLTEIKGVQYLIDAMSILKHQRVDFDLQIYGDGLLRKSLEVQVNNMSMTNCIFFNGFVEHSILPKKLMEADIFVGPSITTSLGETEGLGLVFLEAMAAGLIVIGSNVGGIPDIIKNGKTGLLVEEKKPIAIVNAIKLLVDNNKLRMSIIDGGRSLAKEYDWNSIAQKYLQIYGIDN
jgi:glycosyltransferase involved in cell wall biosynthesis